MCRIEESPLTVILMLVVWWSDQHHLVFKSVNLQFRVSLFSFPIAQFLRIVANGMTCHGYSLVISQLTSST